MRHCRAVLIVASAVLAGFVGLAVAFAQDRAPDQRPGTTADRDTAIRPTSFEGKIQSVDDARHNLVLDNVRPAPVDRGTGASAPPPGAGDRPARPVPPPPDDRRAPPPPPPGDRDRAPPPPPPAGGDRPVETGAKPMPMTFHVGDRTLITLDGQPADLRDLKAGMWARVHVRPAERTGTDAGTRPVERGPDTGTRPPAGAPDRLPATAGRTGQEQNNQGQAQPPRDRVPSAPPTAGDRGTTVNSGPERGRPWVVDRIEASTKAPGSRP